MATKNTEMYVRTLIRKNKKNPMSFQEITDILYNNIEDGEFVINNFTCDRVANEYYACYERFSNQEFIEITFIENEKGILIVNEIEYLFISGL